MSDRNNFDLASVEEVLRTQFKEPEPGFFGKFLERFCGAKNDYDFSILDVEPYVHNNHFRSADLLWIQVGHPILDLIHLPGSRSRGLFAVTSGSSWYLHSVSFDPIARLLEGERGISHLPPAVLAELICDSHLSRKNVSHHLLESIEDVKGFAARSPFQGYLIDYKELDKIAGELQPSQFTPLPNDGGVALRFSALHGWMHEAVNISNFRVLIPHGGPMSCTEKRISARIFAATPAIRY